MTTKVKNYILGTGKILKSMYEYYVRNMLLGLDNILHKGKALIKGDKDVFSDKQKPVKSWLVHMIMKLASPSRNYDINFRQLFSFFQFC